jgi:ferredoxin
MYNEGLINANDALSASTTKIFVYSGTGNSYSAARQLSGLLPGSELIHITAELADSSPLIECGACVLVFPSYAYQCPGLVRRFIKSADFNVDYLALIVTCGSKAGGCASEIKRLLRRNKTAGQVTENSARRPASIQFYSSVQSVENFVHLFNFKTQEYIDARLKNQNDRIIELAQKISSRAPSQKCIRADHPFCTLVSGLFRFGAPLFARRYRTTDACTACGLCAAICPPAAITMIDGKPKFIPKRCDHCQACMEWCPQKAITYGRITPSSPRYRNPDVKITDLIKR